MSPLRIESAIVCDDARQEKSGKYILIGVYLDDIIVPAFPVDLRLVWWVQFVPERSGEFSGQFRILKDDTTLANASFTMHIAKARTTTIPPFGVPIQVQSAGKVRLQWRVGDSEWSTIKEIEVVKKL